MNLTNPIKRQLRKGSARHRLRRMHARPAILSIAVAAIAILLLVAALPSTVIKLCGLPEPRLPTYGQGLNVYDRKDKLVCTIYGDKDQEPVKLAQISPNMQHALIAAEDHDFYTHDGISLYAITRAIVADVTAGHPVQGGSTISQQLIKNLYFEGKKRNLQDKLAEMFMAIELENRYNKPQILEAYLNCVYFGHGVYGVKRASEYYFGKPASKLDIAESAFIASLVTAPSELSLVSQRSRAYLRQQLILDAMEEMKFATAKQVAAAKKQKLVFKSALNAAQSYRHYTNEIVELCTKEFGDRELYARGLNVYTFMDKHAQALAEKFLSSGIRKAPQGIDQGALVSVSVEDGGIIAMVGGAGDFRKDQWNRATSPHTLGSAFKPFVYLAGLNNGTLAPDTMLDDSPLVIQEAGTNPYAPKNYDGQYLGPITIRKAIALSRNTCAVRVTQAVGPEEVARVGQQAGISSKLEPNLSLGLGSSAASPLEMATAYATLARSGEYVDPLMIRRITDKDGKVLRSYQQKREQVFDEEPVAQLVDALQDVVEKGTGTRARLWGRPVAGKTGTSDSAKDIWFVGFTPDTVTAVWGGNDHNKAVKGHVTGGGVMAGVWQDYMEAYYKANPTTPTEFVQPDTPLMEEPEPIHIMPTQSDIFSRIFGVDDSYQVAQPRHWVRNSAQPAYIDQGRDNGIREYSKPGKPIKSKKKKKSLLKRFKDWLDF